MEVLWLVLTGLVVLFITARFIVGVWLFAAPLPLRDGARWRVPLVCAGIYVVYLLLGATLFLQTSASGGLVFSVAQLLTYSLLLVMLAAATLFVFDTSIWTALFCCSAGYTVENLGSGLTELVWSLIGGDTMQSGAYNTWQRYTISIACTLVVFIATYLLITRRLQRDGLERIEDRSMLVMFMLVILVIIGFDLVIKWLVEQGIALAAMVLLRIFHGLACIFTLAMNFQLLITRRAEAERDTLERVLAEQEHQYELARENVSAINARVHDIRHAIGRLASNGGIERDIVRDLVREIDVYDTNVKTGNEALDVVLSERRLQLARQGVTLTCMADGEALGFMAPADVYTLVGSLVDAAISASGTALSLTVTKQMGAPVVTLACQGTEPGEERLGDARAVAQRYGATLVSRLEDGSLRMNVLFPA